MQNQNSTTGQKRVLAIHDLCGVGKCSLTAALPILSAAGIEACAMPTAIFSTHTAFPSFLCHDLNDFLLPMAQALEARHMHFDAIYTGYLANAAQADIIRRVIAMLADEDTLVAVDPAMADNGKLYACLPDSFPAEMMKLCVGASVVTPNITEALLLLGRDATKMPSSREGYEEVARSLADKTGARVVLTSVCLAAGRIGCAIAEPGKEKVTVIEQDYVGHGYHGTGDVFSSVLVAALLKGASLTAATEKAADFVRRVIEKTGKDHPDLWYGVNFESELSSLA